MGLQKWDYYWMPLTWNEAEMRWNSEELIQRGDEGWEVPPPKWPYNAPARPP